MLRVIFVNVQYLYAVCMVIVWYCADWHLIGREGEGDAMMAEQRILHGSCIIFVWYWYSNCTVFL